MPRFIYYIKNEGYYEPVNITEEEYNQSPSLYYRNENGLIVQCDISVPYDPEKVYYIFDYDGDVIAIFKNEDFARDYLYHRQT